MSYSSTGMMNYRESNAYMRTASGVRYPIEGYGDLSRTFRSSSGDGPLLLRNVAHAPSLNYHLLSLRAVADKDHTTYTGNHEGFTTVFFSTGDTLFFPSAGSLNFLYAYRPGMLVDETANATVALGSTPSNRDTPLISMIFTLSMPMPTRERYARQPSKLHECKGCSMAKEIRMSIPSKTNSCERSKPSVVGG